MRLLAAALLLALPVAVPAAPASKAPTAVDWTRTVAMTPVGGFLIGNPRARVRLIEYMSYTCPHCAQFAADSRVPLMRDYVAKGQVAFEIRNLLLNGLDFTAALAVRCGGPARFKGNHEAIFAAQPTIVAAGQTFDAAAFGNNPVAAMQAWARQSGIAALMARRGVPGPALNACIANATEQRRLQAMTSDATEVKRLSGTPSFFIGERRLATNTWEGVEAELRAALN